jgi:hypothetical protein
MFHGNVMENMQKLGTSARPLCLAAKKRRKMILLAAARLRLNIG